MMYRATGEMAFLDAVLNRFDQTPVLRLQYQEAAGSPPFCTILPAEAAPSWSWAFGIPPLSHKHGRKPDKREEL
jgi:hypothetical protein